MSTSAQGSDGEARFYTREGDRVRCSLCPHSCLIADKKRGLCGVRENRSGRLYSLIYGMASSIHPDPIEKKPLFHFLPGSTSLSFGTIGCNLFCMHCQNYEISRAKTGDLHLTPISPSEVVEMAKAAKATSISWTYNEPTIWHEFTTVASKAAHSAGLKTVYVTNGYIQEKPLRELKGIIDAMNIDVKGFRDEFYKAICGGKLEPVLQACELAVDLGIHVELTYLIIPEHNDSEKEIGDFCKWSFDKLGANIPIHFSAFHPDYKLKGVPRTPSQTMSTAYDVAKKAGMEHVYLGNVFAGDRDDTFCPKCGTRVIDRDGFWIKSMNLVEDRCGNCGANLNLVI